MPHRFCISETGYNNLKKELDVLINIEMPQIKEAVKKARAHGDLRENGEYQAAKQLERITNDRLLYLNNLFKNAKVVKEVKNNDGCARFGCWVSIKDENESVKKFKIVGEYESNFEKSFFSISSPIAKSCLGKKVEDIFSVHSPSGEKEYEVISIEYDL